MLTIRDIQQRTLGFFESKNVPNAKLDTDLLIAHSLRVKRLELYLDLDRPLTEAQLDALRPLVKRRASREPLQYILGSVEFCELTLKVDARALIPRPETEELVEYIGKRLNQAPARILDLGTGTGALALALAHKYPAGRTDGRGSERRCPDTGAGKRRNHKLAQRVRFLQGSWFDPVPQGEQFDLIVSNPPYLTEMEMTTAEPEVVDMSRQAPWFQEWMGWTIYGALLLPRLQAT